jgi:hypothetical protein
MYNGGVLFEWDTAKAASNFAKHGVGFSEALAVFDDDFAIAMADDESEPSERRFVALGMGVKGRILAVVYCYRADSIRVISARRATGTERKLYEDSR